MNYLILINKHCPIPSNYKVDLDEVADGYYMQRDAAKCARAMLKAMERDGLDLCVYSAYRTYDYQSKNLQKSIDRYMKRGMDCEEALEMANIEKALPNHSEHNAGLAIDVGTKAQGDITRDFENTPEFEWLQKNAYKYGFILRYPKDKTDITQYKYEPWHYRYVGCPHAGIITKNKITLEEYINLLNGSCNY